MEKPDLIYSHKSLSDRRPLQEKPLATGPTPGRADWTVSDGAKGRGDVGSRLEVFVIQLSLRVDVLVLNFDFLNV